MSDKEAEAEELAFSERIFKNLEARADLERRTVELLRRLLASCGGEPIETTEFEDDARALLAEWEARR